MKAIILAAGQGTRLMPLTAAKPKCMVEFRGLPILDHILKSLRQCAIDKIVVATGYKADAIDRSGVKKIYNKNYSTTNMVATLFETVSEWDDDLVVSYSDIIYKAEVLMQLKSSPHPISVVVDLEWLKLWQTRMDDPLNDAETLKIKEDGTIKELGKKPRSYADIEGQYIGLVKFRKDILDRIKEFYFSLKDADLDKEQSISKMYMTTFLQLIIDKLMNVHPVFIRGGWMEIDSLDDIERLKNYSL